MLTRPARLIPGFFLLVFVLAGCRLNLTEEVDTGDALHRRLAGESVLFHAEDAAIFINVDQPDQSIILGTDLHQINGAIYAYTVDGRLGFAVEDLLLPVGIDVERLRYNNQLTSVAVITDQARGRLHVYRLPTLERISSTGIPVFEGGTASAATGVALYRRPQDGELFAIVSRKTGPQNGYLAQYRLDVGNNGIVGGTLVRTFGQWSGKGEIEAVAVDARNGWVYYADETYGVLKYPADPDAPNAGTPLAVLATEGYSGRREGIALYTDATGPGYLLVLEKGEPSILHVYERNVTPSDPHTHREIGQVPLDSPNADGLEVTSTRLNSTFAGGMLVVAAGRTFDYYAWSDIEARLASGSGGTNVITRSRPADRP